MDNCRYCGQLPHLNGCPNETSGMLRVRAQMLWQNGYDLASRKADPKVAHRGVELESYQLGRLAFARLRTSLMSEHSEYPKQGRQPRS